MRRERKRPGLTTFARSLRKNSTPGETKLWKVLAESQKSTGIRFHRQKPIGKYIADFYCPAFKCVIEIDGLSHEVKVEKDREREEYLQQQGLTVLRFTERDANENSEAIVETVFAAFGKTLG